MNENNIVHLIDENIGNNHFALSFVSILERAVGVDYYSYLFIAFSSLESLKNKNLELREKINQNNSYINNFEKNVDSLKEKIAGIKNKQLKEIESLIDIKYNENLNNKVEEIKEEINTIFNELIEANNALLPSENLDAEISSIKAEIKEILLDIKFAYSKLRTLGSLNIFNPRIKEECRIEFLSSVEESNENANEVFEKLWNLALDEANGLNKIANMAKQVSLKYPTGLEEFDDIDIKKIEHAINEYDSNFSRLTKITDEELLNS